MTIHAAGYRKIAGFVFDVLGARRRSSVKRLEEKLEARIVEIDLLKTVLALRDERIQELEEEILEWEKSEEGIALGAHKR